MFKYIYFTICLLISFSVVAETVYKKVNPDGSVSFTDQPSTDSEEVKIRKPTTFSPIGLPSLNLPKEKLSPNFNYQIIINQPVNDAVIVGDLNVTVSVSIQPPLKSSLGHKIRYQLAGQSVDSRSTSETFNNVSRGTHNINVSIIDTKGNVVGPAVSSIFHMKRFFKKPTL